jgi:hypothetical protein
MILSLGPFEYYSRPVHVPRLASRFRFCVSILPRFAPFSFCGPCFRDGSKKLQENRLQSHSSTITNQSLHTNTMPPFRIQCRHQSTYRRTTRRLAMSGAPSMKTSKIAGGPNTSHIIFNPPPTTPNVYHTPLKFMPASDPRRKLYQSAPSLYNLPSTSPPTFRSTSPSKVQASADHVIMNTPGTALREVAFSFPAALAQRIPETAKLPPGVSKPWTYEKQLTQEDVEEIRRLRAEDPWKNTVNYLAKKFGCSHLLVMGIQSAPLEVKKAHTKRVEAAMNKWSGKTKVARRDREKRKELWSRDA